MNEVKRLTVRQINKVDKQIETVVARRCNGIGISILDIQKVYRAGRDAAAAGGDKDVDGTLDENERRETHPEDYEDTGSYQGGYRTFRDGSMREDFGSDR